MHNEFVRRIDFEYGVCSGLVKLSNAVDTQIKHLFPCKSASQLNDEFAFLTRHGSISSYQEFRAMERATINDIIGSIQQQEKEEAEAEQEAMEGRNNKSGMRSY